MIFLDMTPEAQATKAKVNKWDYIKLELFLHSKRNNQYNEKAAYEMGENLCRTSVW